MGPIIAALTFIFSPSDDWMLKRAYELVLDPVEVPSVVKSYDQLINRYPSVTPEQKGMVASADLPSLIIWSEILQASDYYEEAQKQRKALLADSTLSPDLADDVRLRLGETALLDGNIEEAEKNFMQVLAHKGPRSLDAKTDLLITALAIGKAEEAKLFAKVIQDELGSAVETSRAIYPLGLAAYANKNYPEAIAYFDQLENDPRADYFLGLAYRQTDRPIDAMAHWQTIRQKHPQSEWNELAQFQIAETYFSLGDDGLSRTACEKALAENPKLSKEFIFRLASLEMKQGNYAGALARLKDVPMEGELANRANTIAAESMVKLGQFGKMFKTVAKKLPNNATPLSTYQSAWANAFDMEYDKSLTIAEKGLNNFYDPEVTPRLLLLQGMAYEHLGLQAEALATYQTIADRFPQTLASAQSIDWLALSYMRLGRYREAVTHAGVLWNTLNPKIKRDKPDAAFWLAEAHVKLNRYEDAAQHYSEFIAMSNLKNPLYPYAQFEQGMTLAKLGETQGALAQLDQFSKTAEELKKPEWVELAQLQRGNIYFNDRKFENAIAVYREAKNSPKANYYEGLSLHKMDYFTDAMEAWGKLASAHPSSPFTEQAMFRTGRTLYELGRATEAVSAFASYIEKYPESPRVKDALLQSAHALYNSKDIAGAAPLYAQYLEKYRSVDDLVAVTPYLASCGVQMGKTLDEMEVMLKGLPPVDALASLRWEQGAKNYNEKKFDEANNIFARLLTDFPTDANSPEASFYRAESLFNAQQWQDAEGAFNNYLNLAEASQQTHGPLALFHKGVSIYQQDKLLASAKVFENLVNDYPADPLANDARNNLILAYHNLGNWDTRDLMKSKYGEPTPVQPAAPKPEMENKPEPPVAQNSKERPYLVEKDKLNVMRMEKPKNWAEASADASDEVPSTDPAN